MDGNTLRGNVARTNRVLLGLAALILVALIGLSYYEWRQYYRANAAAALRQQTIDAVDGLLTSLTEAETGQRGFLLTGENRYLQPYNQAVPEIPNELAALRSRLSGRPDESGNLARLSDLVERKLTELRQTIEVRRTRGTAPAIAIDEGKRVMDEIRALCAQIQRNQNAATTEASREGETAAGTALLATVTAALALFFLFATGQRPGAEIDPRVPLRPWPVRYGVAILAAAAAFVLRAVLTPLIGPVELAFSVDLAAVLFAAWFGGLLPGVVCLLGSGIASAYYFAQPVGSFLVHNRSDQISFLIFLILGFGIALLADSQRQAVERAVRAESAEREERQRFETTLTSIGDAVVATDAQGRVTFANRVALSLLRWPPAEISGRPLGDVFRIVNEYSREAVESPVDRVLRDGNIVGLANHTILIARDGTEVPIDDSAAPIRVGTGPIQGTVLVFRDIAERRRAEATGRLLASIVESSEDAVLSEDLNGIVTSWNKGAERIFGFAAEEIIGLPVSVLAPPDRVSEVRTIRDRIQRNEHVDPIQTVRQTKSGKLIHASITISPLFDGAGRITGASKIIRDITAQLEAQAEIAEHRERLRVTLQSIGDGVVTTDISGRISYLNPVAERLTGWTSAEARTRPLEEVFRIVNEESRRTVEDSVTRVLKEGQVVGLANRTVLISRQGREISIDDSAAPMLDARGRMIGAVLVFRDITEKRAAEAEVQRTQERQATILKHLPLGVGVIDTDGRVVVGNPVWKQFLPGGIPSMDDDESADWSALGSDGRPLGREENPVHRALQGEEVLPGIDFLHKDSGGAERWVRMAAVPLRDPGGRITGALTLLQDIEEERRAEERRAELLAKERALAAERALRETEAELARVVRALSVGELASSIAHEINQPLAGVVTNAEAALRWLGEPPNVEEARQSLALIARDGNRTSAVIRRIREFLRKEPQPSASLDLSDVIQEAVALARAELVKRNIRLRIDLPRGLPRVRGDRIQLQQVILNLVMNAAEAMDSTAGAKELLVSSETSADGLIVVAVRDSGIGVSPQQMPQMFEAFFTTKATGMGMGLSISRSIVEAHGGRIWAAPNEGPGLTVRFALPAEAATHAAGNRS
jgi:PAS domain S-box-containing protein